jgi:hypothetical protein
MIHPIVLGSGKRLFSDHGRMSELSLSDCRQLSTGSMILTYVQAPADGAAQA